MDIKHRLLHQNLENVAKQLDSIMSECGDNAGDSEEYQYLWKKFVRIAQAIEKNIETHSQKNDMIAIKEIFYDPSYKPGETL